MASGELGIPTTAPALIAKVKTLTNAYLKDVLRDEHLALSGPKATMQDRILKRKPLHQFRTMLRSFLFIGTASASIVLSTTTEELILKYFFHGLDIDTVVRNGDVTALTRIKNSVYKHGTSYVGDSSTTTNIPPPQSSYNMPLSATRSPGLYSLNSTPYAGACLDSPKVYVKAHSSVARPTFKDSPFFTVIESLTPVMECKGNALKAS